MTIAERAERILRRIEDALEPIVRERGELRYLLPEIQADIKAAYDETIATPEIEDFVTAFKREAVYQGERWKDDDAAKRDGTQWHGLALYLMGKVMNDQHEADDKRTPRDRRLHRIIATAAACFHWHRAEKKERITYPYQQRQEKTE